MRFDRTEKGLIFAIALLTAALFVLPADAKPGKGRGKGQRTAAVEAVVSTTTTTLYRNGAQRAEEKCIGGEWSSVVPDGNGCDYFCMVSSNEGLTFSTLYPCD